MNSVATRLKFHTVHFSVPYQVLQTQTQLLEIQPDFKNDLLNGVEKFKVDVVEFYDDYAEK